MTTISISALKINPASAIRASEDYPVAVQNRSETQAYLVGKGLFEKLMLFVEDMEDKRAIEKTNFSKGRDFEEIAEELGI